MAKVKRPGKGSARGKPKGKAKPEPAASMAVVASVTRTVTVVSAGPTSAGAMPVAFAAESVTAQSVTAESFTATSVTVAAGLAAPVADAELFDVVCSFDSVVLSSVDFGLAQSTARKHNKAHPVHDAQPIRQQQ